MSPFRMKVASANRRDLDRACRFRNPRRRESPSLRDSILRRNQGKRSLRWTPHCSEAWIHQPPPPPPPELPAAASPAASSAARRGAATPAARAPAATAHEADAPAPPKEPPPPVQPPAVKPTSDDEEAPDARAEDATSLPLHTRETSGRLALPSPKATM